MPRAATSFCLQRRFSPVNQRDQEAQEHPSEKKGDVGFVVCDPVADTANASGTAGTPSPCKALKVTVLRLQTNVQYKSEDKKTPTPMAADPKRIRATSGVTS